MSRLRVGLVVVGLALGMGAEWVSYETGELDAALADLVVGWALVACGLFAWDRRRETRVGPLMLPAGVAWFLGSVVPAALFLHRGPLVHLLMSYPSGRVRRRLDRAVVAAAYVDGAIAPLARSPVATIALAAALAGRDDRRLPVRGGAAAASARTPWPPSREFARISRGCGRSTRARRWR